MALAEGFMGVKYLVLHKLKDPIVFGLKAGPHLITKEQLGDAPHKMIGEDIYLLFQIESELPAIAAQISQYALTHPSEGYSMRQSYVTDMEKLLSPQE